MGNFSFECLGIAVVQAWSVLIKNEEAAITNVLYACHDVVESF